MEKLKQRVDDYVKNLCENHQHRLIKESKAIHDSVHGTSVFEPYEIAFIELPIIQRLHHISQTDVASLVYPSANHNRFEHTLGVAAVAKLMIDELYNNLSNSIYKNRLVDKTYALRHVRVAALLHDTGHGPFSHLSESIYRNEYDFKKLREANPVLKGGNPHEILSYYIATSQYLKKFNNEIIKKIYNVEIDLDFVGEIIVGYIDKINKKNSGYIVNIINGPFDADKLDYMARDSHATGISLSLDVNRLLHTLNIIEHNGVLHLAIDISGVSALEQVVFNKMMLYSSIYHHHKVRAAGCMLKTIIKDKFKYKNDISKYISLEDYNVYSEIKKSSKDFIFRNLPMRALAISKRSIRNKNMLSEILNWSNVEQEQIIYKICEKAKEKLIDLDPQHIWIDIPDPPKFKEASLCPIVTKKNSGEYITLNDVFPSDEWAKAFTENKWQGFIFVLHPQIKEISQICEEVLSNDYHIDFNESAKEICKLL